MDTEGRTNATAVRLAIEFLARWRKHSGNAAPCGTDPKFPLPEPKPMLRLGLNDKEAHD